MPDRGDEVQQVAFGKVSQTIPAQQRRGTCRGECGWMALPCGCEYAVGLCGHGLWKHQLAGVGTAVGGTGGSLWGCSFVVTAKATVLAGTVCRGPGCIDKVFWAACTAGGVWVLGLRFWGGFLLLPGLWLRPPEERTASDGLHCCLHRIFQGTPLKGGTSLNFTR